MAISATEGPAGAGSTVALPREVMCWQGPLQSPRGVFWRAPARAGAQRPRRASSKGNPVITPRRGPPWSATSHGNERHFGTGLPVTAWGHQHHKACGPSPARSAWSPCCFGAVTRTDARQLKKFTPAFRIVHNCLRLSSALETPLKVPMNFTGDWHSPRMTLLRALAGLLCLCKKHVLPWAMLHLQTFFWLFVLFFQ